VDEPTEPEPPRIERIALPPLTDPSLDSGDVHEGERYEGLDWWGTDREFWSFTGCAFHRVGLDGTRLRGVHFHQVTLAGIDAPDFAAPRSEWRNVSLTESRLGSAELYESVWRSVTLSGCKINYLNARTATWQDVVFADCSLGELDLGDARVARLAFRDCRIETLTLSGARLAEVDLRGAGLSRIVSVAGLAGAWVTQTQLSDLAPLLAEHLQIRVAT
jgi:uncharacterized protein YjbI with pentapeptide repeats